MVLEVVGETVNHATAVNRETREVIDDIERCHATASEVVYGWR